MPNLIAGLMKEIQRNRELLQQYEVIPQGKIGALLLKERIRYAEQAIEEGDIAAMVSAYKNLRDSE